MEDDSIESSGGSGLISLSLAVLGIVVGGAGLYFGMSANQRLNAVNATVEASSGTDARLEKQVERLSLQVEEISAKVNDQASTLARQKTYSNLSERAIKALEVGIKEDREAIQKLANQISELGSRSVKPPSTQTVENAPSARTPESNSNVYVIESGDTFAKIAAKAGMSLQTILDLNPETDPRRLRIGQEIILPSN